MTQTVGAISNPNEKNGIYLLIKRMVAFAATVDHFFYHGNWEFSCLGNKAQFCQSEFGLFCPLKCLNGYLTKAVQYMDSQMNATDQIPHFVSKSRRKVSLTNCRQTDKPLSIYLVTKTTHNILKKKIVNI